MKNLFNNLPLRFDRSFSKGLLRQVLWLVGIMAIVYIILVGLSSISSLYTPGSEDSHGRWYDILLVLIDPGSGSGAMSSPFIIICAVLGLIIFSGMLISVISNVLERRVESYKNGETTYNLSDHIVIIGYNDSVPSLVRTLRTKDKKVRDEKLFIVIQSGQATEDVRNRFHLASEEWMEKNTLVLHGESHSEEDLEKLHIDKCKEVWIIGDDTLEAHDSTNMECLSLVSLLWAEKHGEKEKLHCHVLFEYQTVYSVFQFSELQDSVKKHILFHPFNLHENWAKKVLVEGKAGEGNEEIKYKPLEEDSGLQKDSKKHVHMIIIGMSRMGTAMAVETAQTAHYFNFREDDNTTRTHITFIDCNAKEEMDIFMSRFPNVFDMMRWRYINAQEEKDDLYTLTGNTWNNPIEQADSPYKHLGSNFTDLQWEFIDGRVESSAVRRYLTEAVNDDSAITTIAVCLPDAQQATQAALYLPDRVLRKAHQVLVYQEESDAIIRSVNNPKDSCTKYDHILPFGIINDSYSNNQIGDFEGMWINAYYDYLYSKQDYEKGKLTKEIWIEKEKDWKEKDERWVQEKWDDVDTKVSDKWSSIHSANMIHTKLRTVGVDMNSDLDAIRSAFETHMPDLVLTEHNRWLTEQLLAGFRPFNKSEWDEYDNLPTEEAKVAKRKKKPEKAHANICSNTLLHKEEPNSHKKDEQVTMALIEIIEQKRKEFN